MLFQDRVRIGDRRQRRHQALHPVIWLAMAVSEVDIWTAIIQIIRVACVRSVVTEWLRPRSGCQLFWII